MLQKRSLDVQNDWKSLKHVIENYPDDFPQNKVNFELFTGVYAQVFSRIISRGVDSPSFVPVVELFNHDCIQNAKTSLVKVSPE